MAKLKRGRTPDTPRKDVKSEANRDNTPPVRESNFTGYDRWPEWMMETKLVCGDRSSVPPKK